MRTATTGVLLVSTIACSSPRPQTAAGAGAPPPASTPVVVPPPAVSTLEEARALDRAGRQQDYLQALRDLTRSTDPTTRRRALALHAVALHDQKAWAEAAPGLREAMANNPTIAPFLSLRLATAEKALGNHAPAAAVLAETIALGETSAATIARLRLPALYASAGDRARTDSALAQAMATPIDELTENEFVDLATELVRAGRPDLAASIRMRLLTDYTSGRYTEQTYGQLTSEIAALPLADAMALAQKLSRANRYDQALDLLQKITALHPEAATQELYRSVRMRALFNSRNYTTLLTETPEIKLSDPSLMLLRARAAWRDDRRPEFLAGLTELERVHPQSKEAIEARVLRSKYYQTDEVDFDRSVADLSRAIELGAVGNDGENIWTLGWTHTLRGNPAEALRTFDRYIRTYPDGDYKTNSLFWSAKIHDAAGRTAERDARAAQLIAEFPTSYYAYRSRELWKLPAAQASTRAFPDLETALASITGPRIDAVRELMATGLHRDASREMKIVAAQHATNPGAQFLLADVYVAGGEPFKANTILQRNFRDFVRHGGTNIPRRFWEILYPLAYLETFRTEGAKRGIDPYLLVSITRQESGFEPSTVSNAGAVGLMQIMPAEAGRIGDAAGIPNVTRETLFDPTLNIAVGAAEFQQKLTLMKGNQTLAIAAYNAGETAVNDWIARTPPADIDVFIESIPFAETKLYVKTVTRNRSEYRRIYEK